MEIESPKDCDRIAQLRAERELQAIEILIQHASLTDLALARLELAIEAIRRALMYRREDLGMGSAAQRAAA